MRVQSVCVCENARMCENMCACVQGHVCFVHTRLYTRMHMYVLVCPSAHSCMCDACVRACVGMYVEKCDT